MAWKQLSLALIMIGVVASSMAFAQDETAPAATDATTSSQNGTSQEIGGQVKKTVDDISSSVAEQTEEIRRQVDQSPEAQKISAGILQPIYDIAEYVSFPAFHWIAFALMVSGVISYALQLVLGKLVVLARGGFSLAEILSDVQGLLISIVGLFLTTQAAAENSSFTGSAAAVLSSALVGVVLGFLFYLWGQAAELQATKGRRVESR